MSVREIFSGRSVALSKTYIVIMKIDFRVRNAFALENLAGILRKLA